MPELPNEQRKPGCTLYSTYAHALFTSAAASLGGFVTGINNHLTYLLLRRLIIAVYFIQAAEKHAAAVSLRERIAQASYCFARVFEFSAGSIGFSIDVTRDLIPLSQFSLFQLFKFILQVEVHSEAYRNTSIVKKFRNL